MTISIVISYALPWRNVPPAPFFASILLRYKENCWLSESRTSWCSINRFSAGFWWNVTDSRWSQFSLSGAMDDFWCHWIWHGMVRDGEYWLGSLYSYTSSSKRPLWRWNLCHTSSSYWSVIAEWTSRPSDQMTNCPAAIIISRVCVAPLRLSIRLLLPKFPTFFRHCLLRSWCHLLYSRILLRFRPPTTCLRDRPSSTLLPFPESAPWCNSSWCRWACGVWSVSPACHLPIR